MLFVHTRVCDLNITITMVRNISIARSVLECRNLWNIPIVKIKIKDVLLLFLGVIFCVRRLNSLLLFLFGFPRGPVKVRRGLVPLANLYFIKMTYLCEGTA